MLVKRYSNRRLYDTKESRYITLSDLAEKIRQGEEVQVVDAKTGDDLTQSTLTQIIMESRGAAKLLPVSLLVQLIRMGDASLGEFMGRYMSLALGLYLQFKRGATAVSPFNPFATMPFDAMSAFARMFAGIMPYVDDKAEPSAEVDPFPNEGNPEVAELRKEIEELRREIQNQKKE